MAATTSPSSHASIAIATQAFGDLDGGCDGTVYAIHRAPNGDLYLGGDFESCNGVVSPRVIRYHPDTDSFHAIDAPLLAGTIADLAWYQDELVVAGRNLRTPDGTEAGVFRLSKGAWATLGEGAAGAMSGNDVAALLIYQGHLIAGGAFYDVAGQGAARIARWDGSAWSRIGAGLGYMTSNSGGVHALAEFEGHLIAGGSFGLGKDYDDIQDVARWTGEAWVSMGDPDGRIYALVADGNGTLFAAGDLRGANGSQVVRYWTGNAWATLEGNQPSELDGIVLALAVHRGHLIAATAPWYMQWSTIGGLARWTGTGWVRYPGNSIATPGVTRALAVHGDDLYVASRFYGWTPPGLHAVGRLSDGWHRMGGSSGAIGLNAGVVGLASDGDRLIASGSFSRGGSRSLHGIATWQGNEWQRLGDVVPDKYRPMGAVAVYRGDIYAAASLQTLSGDVISRGLARWDGATWLPVVDEEGREIFEGYVSSMRVFEGELVVSGQFALGEYGLLSIAGWDGSRWNLMMNEGLARAAGTNSIDALAEHQGRLIAGGDFHWVGGTSTTDLAAWDGNTWAPLPTGFASDTQNRVDALGVWEGDLYVAGTLGSDVSLARLRLGQWQALATNLPRRAIRSLAGVGPALWIGGTFSSIGGIPAPGLAYWDGEGFHPVGEGAGASIFGGPNVRTMVAHEGELMIGGHFRSVDGQRSAHIARLLPDVVDGIDMHIRVPVAAPESGAHRVTYRVRLGNRGGAVAVPATLAVSAWPQPLAVTWTCQAGAFSSEPCPADTGDGLPDWTTTMAAGAEFYLDLALDAAPGTVVQRLRLDLSAPPVPGAGNLASAGLTVTTALAEEVLFVDGFESASNR